MSRIVRTCLAMSAVAASLFGGGTTTWESNSFNDFIRGRFSGLSLTREGRIMLAPRLEPVLASGQAAIWCLATAKDGTVYAGTGHRGRIYQIEKDGKSSVLWDAAQPEVFALAVDPGGVLYAGTSPDGKVYRIERGKATEYFDPGAKYIWALAFTTDGTLYVGTGDQGKVFRVARNGKGEVWFDSGQSHITGLAVDRQNRVLAGSEPNGLLYRIEGKDKAFVLYDSILPEIRSIVPADDGTVYIAALGGSVARQNAQAATAAAAMATMTPAVTTSITVTSDSNAQSGIDIKPKPDAAKLSPPAPAGDAAIALQPLTEVAGVDKSAVYRIAPDNTVETLWTSKEENVFDLAVKGDDVTFATDLRGRIYRLTKDLKTTLLVETREGETTRLIDTAGGTLAGTSNLGKLFRLSAGSGVKGNFESPVHDAASIARWGRLSWRGDIGPGVTVAFRTRSGNSVRPDRTWSDWSEPGTGDGSTSITSPNARYIQWQMELSGPPGATPSIDSVAVTYLPQNGRPVVHGITVTPQWTALSQKQTAAAATTPQAAAYSITVTDTGESAPAISGGTPTQLVPRSGNPQLMISWQADDPDNDKLVYALWFRGEDEKEWKLIKNQLQENTYLLDAETLADGRYLFRVQASDRLANTPAAARESELVSPPVLVDNTPPTVTLGKPRRIGETVEIDVNAGDASSPLRRAEYAVDAGPWMLMEPVDGILDAMKEQFAIRLDKVMPGEHLLVIRVFDSAGNPGLAKVTIR
jgi:hypothetical protein